jgi:hypothetical protein
LIAEKKGKNVTRFLLLGTWFAGVMFSPIPAWSALIKDVTIPFGSGYIYKYTGPAGDTAGYFQVRSASDTQTFRISGSIMKADGDADFNYELYNYGSQYQTTFQIGSSSMYDDYSTGSPLWLAQGSFTSGAVLTLYGYIRDKISSQIWGPFTILTATIDQNFDVLENPNVTNQVLCQTHFHVTSGELATGAITGIKLRSMDFTATWQFNSCTQSPYPGVQDFQKSIIRGAGSQVQFVVPVPEPMSLLLLTVAGGYVSLKRIGKKTCGSVGGFV